MQNSCHSQKRSFFKLCGLTILVFPALAIKKSFALETELEPIEQLAETSNRLFINRAFEMRHLAIANGDQGYGALVVRDGIIVGQAPSRVVVNRDPTAHAEMEAIRDASRRLKSRDLRRCILFSSSRACPMCEAGAYWAGIENMIYGEAENIAGTPSLCC